MTVPVMKDRNVEKTGTRTLSGVKGRAPGAVLNEEEVDILDGAFSLSTSAHSAANLQVRQIQNGVRTFTSLLSLSLSPIIIAIPLSRSARRDPVRFWRTSMLCPRRYRSLTGVVLSSQTPNPG
jgi:hypothetical protein